MDYEAAREEFERWWATKPPHLYLDLIYRVVALEAYLAASGFELGGKRLVI